MKIKSQFILSIVILASILLVVIFFSLVINAQIDQIHDKVTIASNVHSSANDLSLISDNYIISQENAQVELWRAQFSLVSNNITILDSMNLEQQAIVDTLEEDAQILNDSFSDIIFLLESTPRNQSVRVVPEFQASWNQLSERTHSLIVNSEQLSDDLSNQADNLHLSYAMLVVLLLGLFGVFLSVNYFIIYRHTLKSISKLQTGAAVIGSGNLDYSIKVEKDEIGELSNSFNQMATNLKNITTSKAELEKEVAKRKKAEQQLEQYNKNLEALVEERTQQLRNNERLAAIGQVAGMVGHDIRNPLQAINSELYLTKTELEEISKSAQKDALKESIGFIEKQVSYIDKIINDLQDYTKPLKPELVEVNLCTAISESISTVEIPSNIQLNIACSEPALELKLDADFLKRIMINLVNNAIQAMPNGGKLTINASSEKNKVFITVEDTGVGIPKETQKKLFTPLFTTKSKGQGFGLVAIKRMTEALGGTITFESQESKGTKFTVMLPVQK